MAFVGSRLAGGGAGVARVVGQQQVAARGRGATGGPTSWCGTPGRGAAASRLVETGSGSAREPADVRDALLLVDDQVEDHVQVLGLGHGAQRERRRAVGAAVVHVHVQVAAPPPARRPVGDALERDALRARLARRRRRACGARGRYSSPRVTSSVTGPAGTSTAAPPCAVEVAVLDPALGPVEVVVGVAPRALGHEAAAVRRW